MFVVQAIHLMKKKKAAAPVKSNALVGSTNFYTRVCSVHTLIHTFIISFR